MKKYFISIAVLVLVLASFSAKPVNAQGLTGDWTSNISCQNQSDTTEASVELIFYQEDTGTETSLGVESIPAGMSTNFVITSLPEDSVGSMVVRSSQAVTCAIDYSKVATGTELNPYRFAATKGFDQNEISPVMYVSQIEKDFYGWNSYIAIQNTADTAKDVTVSFIDRFTTTYPDLELNIPAYANHVIYLADLATLPSNFIGGAKIVADDGVTPLAVTTAFYNSGVDPATSQIHAWNGSAVGSDTLYAPYIVMNYYLYNSGIMVQNVGDTSTSFKITYTFNGTDYVYQHPTELQAGEVKDFYLPDVAVLAPVNSIANMLRYGKATIEATNLAGVHNSSGELIANINQENRGGEGIPVEFAGNGGTYGAFPSTAGSSTNFIAKWMVHVGGFSSGFHISNYSGSAVSCDFIFPADTDANFTEVIGVNSFFTKWAPNVTNLDTGFNSGVKIECDGDVFVITNASNDPDVGKYGDSFYQMTAGGEFVP